MIFPAILWALAVLTRPCRGDDSAPTPLVIPASQYFEGNDGPWSTFDLKVGQPDQYLRVLVSTASPFAIVPLAEIACSSSVFETVPADCAVSRGNLFNTNQSSTWHELGLYGINQNGVGLEANLGYDQRAQWGQEHIGIGLNGPELDNQTVAGIATPEPFYLGVFGLNNQPANLSTLGNFTSASFITTLKDQKKIPSISWSYTAGAKYRLKQVYGQLIFSGYDTSRFEENSVSFSMAEDVTRDLVVSLQSISYSGSTSTTLLSQSIDIFIDSTDPNLWLPAEACDAFEKAFGLTLDAKTGLYLVNDTHRNQLLDSNAEVTFRLSDVKSGGDTVTVVLPYAAFDLTAKSPLVENETHYFPLKRANNSGQYTLGRVFLQEAYLSADYERKVFNVSACVWNQGAQQNIVAITSTDPNSPGGSGSGKSSLSGGTIAGIVIGAVLGALLLAAIIALFILRKRRKWIGKGYAVAAKPIEPDESVLKGPVFNSPSYRNSTPSSAPFSADDISGSRSRSTGENTRAGSAAGMGAVAGISPGAREGVELDGAETAVRPNTELDGHEVHGPLPPVAENPSGVFELPGTAVEDVPRAPSTVASLASRDDGHHSPPSPITSTAGRDSGWVRDSGIVSPNTPRHSQAF
ncbi:acid protease [Echria macrotheca]|uniref:Acid protease n=1 Tax=Echria macrotheca TaxID=438768 RepID=A0AAJ0B8V4_9PEZI|nr:acid protease [Echria macrotheca]